MFGRLKKKFSILLSEIRLSLEHAPQVIIACAILHNLAIQFRMNKYQNGVYIDPDIIQIDLEEEFTGLNRDVLVENYFLTYDRHQFDPVDEVEDNAINNPLVQSDEESEENAEYSQEL
uniref:DDE Tnp4 domain-containing protein n=1 Tax=Acrobeloides nanus TaxID=290746 RepID=A0A914CVM7_9BILA